MFIAGKNVFDCDFLEQESTNSCGPVLSYFFSFPDASVASGCTVISLLSNILEPAEDFPSPDFVRFCFVPTFVRFNFILFANFFHLLTSDIVRHKDLVKT